MALESAHADRCDIVDRLTKAVLSALSSDASETQQVANLVCTIPKAINDLGHLFHARGSAVSAGGVFVHGRPLVTSPDFPQAKPKAVEIGDLLLVLRRSGPGGPVWRSALLLQAKKASWPFSRPRNENQHWLYAFWPQFAYTGASKLLTDSRRQVTGPKLHSGSKYLILPKGLDSDESRMFCSLVWPCKQPYCVADGRAPYTARATWPEFTGHQCFILELYDFLFGDAGRPFLYPAPPGNTNWDRVIGDLLEATAREVAKSMHASPESKRGVGVLCFLSVREPSFVREYLHAGGASGRLLWTSEEFPRVPERPRGDNQGDGGISVIEITIEDKDG